MQDHGENGTADLSSELWTWPLIPTWRIEILVFLLATECNQLRSVYFDPLLLHARGVFFWNACRENLSTFFLEEFEDSYKKEINKFVLVIQTWDY